MDLTDEQWAVLEPLIGELPRRADGRGRPWRSSREVRERQPVDPADRSAVGGSTQAVPAVLDLPICPSAHLPTGASSAGCGIARWSAS